METQVKPSKKAEENKRSQNTKHYEASRAGRRSIAVEKSSVELWQSTPLPCWGPEGVGRGRILGDGCWSRDVAVFARIPTSCPIAEFFFKKERCFWFVLATVLLILVKHFCWHQRFAQNMQIAADWDLPRAILTVWKSRWNSLFKQSLRNLQSMDWYVIRPSDLRLSSRQWFKVWKMERDCAIVCSLVWRGVFAKSSVVSL